MGEYDRVWFRDEQITRRQRGALLLVEDELEKEGIFDKFTNLQGSWQSDVEASGSTHSGAGCCDLWLPGMGDNDRTYKITRIMRRTGHQGAMLRGPGKFGGYPWHWHTFDLDTHGMAASTIWQVGQYRAGNEAISSSQNGPDPVPFRPDPLTKFDWDKYVAAEQARKQLGNLNDRIEDKVDTLEDLRKERADLRRKIQRLMDH